MNRMLAAFFGFFNGVLALFLVVVGGLSGFLFGDRTGEHVAGAVIGLLGGLLVAIVTCGLFAVLLDIRSELKKLSDIAQRTVK
jgi:hypothetical protein